MSKKIKKAYTDNPTAGDDTTTEGYTPFDDGSDDELARSDTQLAEVMRVRLGLGDPPAQPGDTTAPVISSFSATIDPDTLVADLVWQVTDNVGVTGWIVKEDDSTLPDSGDSDWSSTEPTTFTLSNYNLHTLTARARDAAGNVSSPVTITIQGNETTGSPPVIDSFSTTNPIADSSEFGFTLDASNATHYKFIYNSNTPPLVGDSGWTAEAFASPLTSSATLDSFVDSTVYAYVKDATDVSPAVTSFVDVTTAGDKSGSDWLWANDPSTIIAYGTTTSIDLSGSGALVIDGTVSSEGVIDGDDGIRTGNGADNNSPLITISGANYTSIEIKNLHILNGRGPSIRLNTLDGCTVTVRNNKFGACNINGEAANMLEKNAIVFDHCANCTVSILGNWFNQSDGGMQFNHLDNSSLSVRNNFVDGWNLHTTAASPTFVTYLQFIGGGFGNFTGDITQNIIYDPSGERVGEDLISATSLRGSVSVPFDITRNRFWKTIGGTGAGVQIGDGTYNSYLYIDENTFIDINSPGQFSTGHHHKFINNKAYTSEANPAIYAGALFQVSRFGADPGKLHDCTYENNTGLHFKDVGGGTLAEIGVWFPRWGDDGLRPNHGECVGTCDDADNTTPTGYSNNENSHSEWANGQGKSELWRASWNTFSYAGSDGLTPTITYDSPWIGDGGSQNFSASSVTSSSFGDGAAIDAVQTHDVLSLGIGGVTPYTIASVTAVTNCDVSNNVTGVIFTAGSSGGAFTYQYTLTDDTGAQATGTISGTIASAASSRNYYDQGAADFICITMDDSKLPQTPSGSEDPNYEYFSRNGYAYTHATGSSSPDSHYMQTTPYSGNEAIGDVETNSAEMVFHVNLKSNATTYKLYINGMALYDANYNSCWAGIDNTPNANHYFVTVGTNPIGTADWYWADASASPATILTTSANQKVTINVWVREGGFALGKILLVESGTAQDPPSGVSQTESSIVEY